MFQRVAFRVWPRLPWMTRRVIVLGMFWHGPVAAVAIIRDGDGRVLLVQPTYRRDGGWGLPGGFCAHHERPSRAVVREVREELGLLVTGVTLLSEGAGEFGEAAFAFAAETTGAPASKSPEIRAWQFFAADDLPPLPPPTAALLDAALAVMNVR